MKGSCSEPPIAGQNLIPNALVVKNFFMAKENPGHSSASPVAHSLFASTGFLPTFALALDKIPRTDEK